jgi:IclR family transcriptional regulator, acetate operon repressor
MIRSVLKAIDVMCVFSSTEPTLTLGEISERLNMPKSTTHNLLNTLASRGFIEKVNDDSYALGTAVISLSQAVRVNAHLRDRAAPLLRELADIVKESVYLTYLDGDHALYIYAIETSNRLMARSAIGDRVRLHCTGVGKAILAAFPDEKMEDIVQRTGLPGFTENTITTLDELKREMEQTRLRGYSIDRGEHEKGIFCVGAVIRDAAGIPIGGCSISGLDPEIIAGRAAGLSADLLYAAQEISRRMGHVPATPSLLVQRSNHSAR